MKYAIKNESDWKGSFIFEPREVWYFANRGRRDDTSRKPMVDRLRQFCVNEINVEKPFTTPSWRKKVPLFLLSKYFVIMGGMHLKRAVQELTIRSPLMVK